MQNTLERIETHETTYKYTTNNYNTNQNTHNKTHQHIHQTHEHASHCINQNVNKCVYSGRRHGHSPIKLK